MSKDNNEPKVQKLSTDSYKGVRDFFPADMAVQKKIFDIWRKTAERYGYEEYGASILEPADLYRAKSGEELINEQTYTFIDRGDREVTLRPEMTPTLARMVAARKRELIFPLRWYSIPNLFRYEQPQRGRLREHWQLNVDLFGVESINAEIEIINMASDITKAYGLKDSDFEIRINNRKVVNYILSDVFDLDPKQSHRLAKLIDKKEKLKPEIFTATVNDIFGTEKTDDVTKFITLLNSKNFEEFAAQLPQSEDEHEGIKEVRKVIAALEELGITNARFDQTLMRGFDYYTGTVFEVFDLNPENRRAVLGGGRFDELLALFGNEKVPAVGFGAGDVTARDLMETYGTIAKPSTNNSSQDLQSIDIQPPADIAIAIMGEESVPFALETARDLREEGLRVVVDLSKKKIGDQIKNADKRHIPKVIVIGDEEVKTGKLKVKDLKTGEQSDLII